MIFIRIEDSTTGCYAISNLELHSNIIETGLSLNVITECDDSSNDGIANFELNDVETQLANGYDGFEFTFPTFKKSKLIINFFRKQFHFLRYVLFDHLAQNGI